MKTLIVGLGNPILGDDGVGWRVAEEVCKQLPKDLPVDVECLSLGGISLMEHLIGYDYAILVDAFAMDAPVGSISVLKLSQLPNYSAYHIPVRTIRPCKRRCNWARKWARTCRKMS